MTPLSLSLSHAYFPFPAFVKMLRRSLCLYKQTALKELGVSGTASFPESKAAYKMLVKTLHPDATTGLSEEERARREETFKSVSASFARLELIYEEGAWDEAQHQPTPEEENKTEVNNEWNRPDHTPINTIMQWEEHQRRRIYFSVKTLQRTKRSQHLPISLRCLQVVPLEVVAGWVREELERQNLSKFFHLVIEHEGPIGVPCISIMGQPVPYHEAHREEEQNQRSVKNSIFGAYRKVVDFMNSPA